jgi:hypothetical protein
MATTYTHQIQRGGRKHASTRLRAGMWVKVGPVVGICNALFIEGPRGLQRALPDDDRVTHIEFHRVDFPAGQTIGVEIEPAHRVRQAALMDIPIARRPDVEQARHFGYA